jgi:tetratricopeptide (TPR) repeat protein
MQRRLLINIMIVATSIMLSINSINVSTPYAADKKPSQDLKNSLNKIDDLEKKLENANLDLYRASIESSKQSMDTANALIKYVGVIATIFGIIIALAGIFIALEGNRSRKRRKEAIKSFENAKQFVEKVVDDFQKTIQIKSAEFEKLCGESRELFIDQLNRDTEETTRIMQEARDQIERDSQVVSQAIKEREAKGIKTESEQKIDELEKRIRLFEEIGIPDDPKLLYSKALILKEKELYYDSLKLLRKLVSLDPTKKSAFLQIGAIEGILEHHDESIDAYCNYINLDQDNAVAYNNLAVQYYKIGNYPKAVELSERAIMLKPDSELYVKNLNAIRGKMQPV